MKSWRSTSSSVPRLDGDPIADQLGSQDDHTGLRLYADPDVILVDPDHHDLDGVFEPIDFESDLLVAFPAQYQHQNPFVSRSTPANGVCETEFPMKCVFCGDERYPQGDPTGKDIGGVVSLTFDSGRRYVVPSNLDHLILAHGFQPPASLVGDLMNSRQVSDEYIQAQGRPIEVKVGRDYPMGGVPSAAPYRLREYIKISMSRIMI